MTNTKEHVVLYHHGCPDGFGAAWAAWKRLGNDADYHSVKYGDPMPALEGVKRLTIVDFSYPRAILEKLAETMHVTVLDHHLSAQKDLEGLPFAHFDMDHSGAYLAWQYFNGGTPTPRLIEHIEDRDIWKWQLPGSKEITAALDMYPFDFEVWDNLVVCLDQLFTEGTTLLKYRRQLINQAMKPLFMDIMGHLVPVVNTTVLQSDVGNELCKAYPESKFSVSYFDDLQRSRRVWSLRSVGEFDVSEIAKVFGGGGHRNAAGFTTPAPAMPVLQVV